MTEAKAVGFIGLGKMGTPLATSLLNAGYSLTVHDISQGAAEPLLARGATWADSPRELADRSGVVFFSLPMPSDVESVCTREDGVFSGMRKGGACFDLSTNSPIVLRRLSAATTGHGFDFLDAPLSGEPAGAAARKLVIWVSGRRAAFDNHLDLLQAMGDRVSYMGEVGAATVAKLVINLSGSAISCLLAETFSLGVKGGVAPLDLWQAMRSSALGRRNTFDSLGDRFLPGNFDPASFALKLAHKDVRLASDLAKDLGVPARICELTLAEMTEAMARGWGDRDVFSMMALQLERAQVDVAVPSETIRAALES